MTITENPRIVGEDMPLSKDEQLKYKALYVKTAKQYVNELRENLSQLGTGNETNDVIDALHISAHALAGQSVIMGYHSISIISSLMEKIFKAKKEKEIDLSDDLLTKLIDAVDAIERSLDSIDKADEEVNVERTVKNLRAAIKRYENFTG